MPTKGTPSPGEVQNRQLHGIGNEYKINPGSFANSTRQQHTASELKTPPILETIEDRLNDIILEFAVSFIKLGQTEESLFDKFSSMDAQHLHKVVKDIIDRMTDDPDPPLTPPPPKPKSNGKKHKPNQPRKGPSKTKTTPHTSNKLRP